MTTDQQLPVIAYKGFNVDQDGNLNCRGYQYAEGETYTQEQDAQLCSSGFHACLDPLDVLAYYDDRDGAVYHRVLLGEDAKRDEASDSKVASRTIKIGARIDFLGMVKLHVEAVWDRVGKAKTEAEKRGRKALESGAEGTSSGDRSTAASSGGRSTAASSGWQSTAASSGWQSTAASSGEQSTAASSGEQSTAASSGEQSTAASSGEQSTAKVTGPDSIAVAGGYQGRASGVDGCWIVLTERDNEGHILDVQAVKVGSKKRGVRIKPGVLYMLDGGEIVEADNV